MKIKKSMEKELFYYILTSNVMKVLQDISRSILKDNISEITNKFAEEVFELCSAVKQYSRMTGNNVYFYSRPILPSGFNLKLFAPYPDSEHTMVGLCRMVTSDDVNSKEHTDFYAIDYHMLSDLIKAYQKLNADVPGKTQLMLDCIFDIMYRIIPADSVMYAGSINDNVNAEPDNTVDEDEGTDCRGDYSSGYDDIIIGGDVAKGWEDTCVEPKTAEFSSDIINEPSDDKDQDHEHTRKEFMDAFIVCRDIFIDKLKDYGPSWRIFRPQSVTDQLYIKGTRIRSLEEMNGNSAVGEGIYPEFCALVNYGIIGLIQLELGYSNTYDMSSDKAMELYDKYMKIAFDLMVKKNHDYDEAWRSMRICSYTDFVLVKLARIKQIEENDFNSGNSEGVDSNYLDIINYSIFGLIKLKENGKK